MPSFVFRAATEQEHDALLHLWTEVFQEPASVFVGAYEARDPADRLTVAAFEGDTPVASVQGYRLRVKSPDGWAHMGGIANVTTLAAYRGHGLAKTLMHMADEGLARMGCDFGYLFTGIPKYYEALGWEHVAYMTAFSAVPEVATSSIDARRVEASDLPHLSAAYAALLPQTVLQLQRNARDWELKLQPRFEDKWLVRDETGYALMAQTEQATLVQEWGFLDGAPIEPLIAAILKFARSQNATEVAYEAPITPSIERAIEKLTPGIQRRESTGGMVKSMSEEWPSRRILDAYKLPNARFAPNDGF